MTSETETFGKYQLIKKLATGGMAEVWLARQTGIEGFNRHVVLKRILPHLAADPDFIQMFLNEAKIASRFNHPNIAQIYDLGERDGQYFITMEFVHGEDLGRVMRKAWASGQWIASPLALRIVANCCEGLYYAHTRTDENGKPLRVVHRDISPQNILISFDGSVKLVDFGIAKAADQASVTKMGAIKGKFAYMAPEQAGGKALDARTDIFAIGLVLYELLTGVRPLKRDSDLGTLQAALECAIDAPSVVAEVSNGLDDVVMSALAKKAENRYRDARQFQMAIEEYLIGQRMVATSVQISELMEMLFSERREEEAKLGVPNPSPSADSSQSNRGLLAPEPTNPATPSARQSQQAGEESRVETRDARALANRTQGDDELDMASGDTAPPKPGGRSGDDSLVAMPLSQESIAPSDSGRRPSSKSGERARSPSGSRRMPSAPARKVSKEAEVEQEPIDPADYKRREAARSKTPVDVPVVREKRVTAKENEERKEGNDRVRVERMRWVVAAAVAAGVVLILGLKVFKSPETFSGTPVLLTVISYPRTEVAIVPGEKGRKRVSLGQTPITDATGVFVGDTVLLTSAEQGIDYEQLIEFRQPNEKVKIEKQFQQGNLVLTAEPATEGLAVYRGSDKLGTLGSHILMYEGRQRLRVWGEEFGRNVEIEVEIKGGTRQYLSLDLSTGKLKRLQ
jgi:serine/threonine protein kinase